MATAVIGARILGIVEGQDTVHEKYMQQYFVRGFPPGIVRQPALHQERGWCRLRRSERWREEAQSGLIPPARSDDERAFVVSTGGDGEDGGTL